MIPLKYRGKQTFTNISSNGANPDFVKKFENSYNYGVVRRDHHVEFGVANLPYGVAMRVTTIDKLDKTCEQSDRTS